MKRRGQKIIETQPDVMVASTHALDSVQSVRSRKPSLKATTDVPKITPILEVGHAVALTKAKSKRNKKEDSSSDQDIICIIEDVKVFD